MKTFLHTDLRIVEPKYADDLTTTIIELEKLREYPLRGPVQPLVFLQLKTMFQMFESLDSARIEGNNTKLREAVDNRIEEPELTDQMRELENIEVAIDFIEDQLSDGGSIDRAFICEIHKIVVKDLVREGDANPGLFRKQEVTIGRSDHTPPPSPRVDEYMNELVEFINRRDAKKYELLKTAVAHHRFTWIHPFANGNGRVVRLLTYAMLMKQGFSVNRSRILNPAAIFWGDREKYYSMLATADSGTDKGILQWSDYVLQGLYTEMVKIDRLLDKEYLVGKILLPSIESCLKRKDITADEYQVLKLAARKMAIISNDLLEVLPALSAVARSRLLRRLRERDMLIPMSARGRRYVLGFRNNELFRAVSDALADEGFVKR